LHGGLEVRDEKWKKRKKHSKLEQPQNDELGTGVLQKQRKEKL